MVPKLIAGRAPGLVSNTARPFADMLWKAIGRWGRSISTVTSPKRRFAKQNDCLRYRLRKTRSDRNAPVRPLPDDLPPPTLLES